MLQQKLEQKDKQVSEQKQLQLDLSVQLEKTGQQNKDMVDKLDRIEREHQVVKDNLAEERNKVKQLEGAREQLQDRQLEVAQLKAKN